VNEASASGAESLVLDFADVNYISSSGLRVVLAASKAFKQNFTVKNCNPDVYGIFEMTGFTDIMDIAKSLRKISLSGCELIGRGAIGSVYRIDDENIVKVYEDNVTLEEVERERINARAAFKAGLPCAITYDTVEADGKIGVVYEMFKAETVASAIMKNPENVQKYADDIAALARTMHSTEASGVLSVKEMWLDQCRCEQVRSKFSDEEIDSMRAVINAVPDAHTFVHGDLHPKNIMVMPESGEYELIDMGDVSYGNPIFDLAIIYTCLYASVRFMPSERVMNVYGMTKKVCDAYYQAFIRSYAPSPPEIWLQIAELAEVRNKLWHAIHSNLS
jgi:uncharacterized protein (TIGR02172 family)